MTPEEKASGAVVRRRAPPQEPLLKL